MEKRSVAILIPAHNEEEVIEATLQSLLKVAAPRDIYVVDDASTDNTAKIAKRIIANILTLKKNQGKAGAMNAAFVKFSLPARYQYIMPVDADTVIAPDFLTHILPIFAEDKRKKIACVIGKIVGRNKKWITTYRLWEYEVAQTIHKSAQAIINAVIVCPGPCTIYRSDIFIKNSYPTGTLVEDMDLTFLIHRKKIGKIVYCPKSIVITQDPKTVRAFLKQIDRWYTGFWQCLIKHNIPWGGQMLDLEVALLALEGLYNGLLVASLVVLFPFALLKDYLILVIPISIDILLFILPTFIFVAIRHHTIKIFLYFPQFYFLRILSSFIFLRSFFKVVFAQDLKMKTFWNTARYRIGKENLWISNS